jgi:hypothetical protein
VIAAHRGNVRIRFVAGIACNGRSHPENHRERRTRRPKSQCRARPQSGLRGKVRVAKAHSEVLLSSELAFARRGYRIVVAGERRQAVGAGEATKDGQHVRGGDRRRPGCGSIEGRARSSETLERD